MDGGISQVKPAGSPGTPVLSYIEKLEELRKVRACLDEQMADIFRVWEGEAAGEAMRRFRHIKEMLDKSEAYLSQCAVYAGGGAGPEETVSPEEESLSFDVIR